MSTCGSLGNVLVAVVLSLAVYYGSFKVPEGTHFNRRIMMLMGKIQEDACLIYGWFGFGEPVIILRGITNAMKTDIPPGIQGHDSIFDGVPVRIYRPPTDYQDGAGVVYIHGGGWVMGTLDLYNELVGNIAKASGMVVVSIDYRLAPEHPFPAGFNDCAQAVRHFTKHATEYGVDPRRIAVAGDSAGGNLAAAVALKLQDQVKAQVLIYPTIQPFNFYTPSYEITGPKGSVLTKYLVVACWLYYAQGHIDNIEVAMASNHTSTTIKNATPYVNIDSIPQQYIPWEYVKKQVGGGNEEVWTELKEFVLNPYYTPIVAPDVSRVPTTLILTVEYDVLRDDGILYAQKLRDAGVKVSHYHSWDGTHGMFMSPGIYSSSSVEKMFNFMVNFLKDVL